VKFEVHTHALFGRGGSVRTITHSHVGGDTPHLHDGSGPASYTIDKDEWFALTGLRGGGRKKFTVKPTGEQLPLTGRKSP
jgi:hypothetical protein